MVWKEVEVVREVKKKRLAKVRKKTSQLLSPFHEKATFSSSSISLLVLTVATGERLLPVGRKGVERRLEFRESEGEEEEHDDVGEQERAVDDDASEIGNDSGAVAPAFWRPRAPGRQPDDAGKLVTRGMCDGAETRRYSKRGFYFRKEKSFELPSR